MARTFRLFVSSTFADLVEERKALAESVFPRLRRLCLTHGAQFQAIDLRWGVSGEAALDQRTMPICFQELERCRRVSPRPNLIVLLGGRYGWRPLPFSIPESEFAVIRRQCDPGEAGLIDEWYLRDDNALPPERLLRARTSEHEHPQAWTPVESRLVSILARAAESGGIAASERLKYGGSATAQEVYRGLFSLPEPPDHVFAYVRDVAAMPGNAEPFSEPDANARQTLVSLLEQLERTLGGHVRHYQADWTSDGITRHHLEALCRDVYGDLERIILDELGRSPEVSPVDEERTWHQSFGERQAAGFVGRRAAVAQIGNYLAGTDNHSLVVAGPPGSGKSTILAHFARQLPASVVSVVRFLGTTAQSSTGRTLLRGLCEQIGAAFDVDTPVPATYDELVVELQRRLAFARPDRPLVLMLDGLDQLPDHDPGRSLVWTLSELPTHVRLVASMASEQRLTEIPSTFPAVGILRLAPMDMEEGSELLANWLSEAKRTLTPVQRDEVLRGFAGNGLPLYLKLAVEEACRWRSHTPTMADTLPADVLGMVRLLLTRLSRDHGPCLVRRTLALVAASRDGLAEEEIIDLASRDPEVASELVSRSPSSPDLGDPPRLPVVVWSRLFSDLAPYLSEQASEGTSVLSFYHRQLLDVVREDFLASREERCNRHRALAEYFGGQPHRFESEGKIIPNRRRLHELPFQLTMAEMWHELHATLTDIDFAEQKLTHIGHLESKLSDGRVMSIHDGVYHLLDDLELALVRWPNDIAGNPQDAAVVVTAFDARDGAGYMVRCPVCRKRWPLRETWLGTVIACPDGQCPASLRVNPYLIPPRPGSLLS